MKTLLRFAVVFMALGVCSLAFAGVVPGINDTSISITISSVASGTSNMALLPAAGLGGTMKPLVFALALLPSSALLADAPPTPVIPSTIMATPSASPTPSPSPSPTPVQRAIPKHHKLYGPTGL